MFLCFKVIWSLFVGICLLSLFWFVVGMVLVVFVSVVLLLACVFVNRWHVFFKC